MSDLDVGKLGTYHSEDGDIPCLVIAYVAGRDGGDHLIGGFHVAAGKGDVFREWTVVGTEQGAFTV